MISRLFARKSFACTPKSSGCMFGRARWMRIVRASPVHEGKQLDVEFEDETTYRFHAEWIRDSSPELVGSDYYRKSAKHLFTVSGCVATEAKPANDGSKLVVQFQDGMAEHVSSEYVSNWLYAFAPYVGKLLHGRNAAAHSGDLSGTGTLLDHVHTSRRPWGAELDMPTFDAASLTADTAMQSEFLERMVDPGVALITGAEAPQGLGGGVVGAPLERLVGDVVGRLNQHPVRSTRYGVIKTRGVLTDVSSDYNQANPLSMHTDHSPYNGTPGYIQFMYQAQGSVRSKVCDGFALAETLRQQSPDDFHILTRVQLTHSIRNCIYGKDGEYRRDSKSEAMDFELVHTHPILQLDADGLLEKVVQSETKRGVSALPFDAYERFMAAYRHWTDLVEQPRFIRHFDWPEHSVIAVNNWRVLHGRASVPAGMDRTMVFGYVTKAIFENRYRYLKQLQAEAMDPLMSDKWLTRLPNQVLQALVQ